MIKIISFDTIYGWINAKEENNLVISISFGKLTSKGYSKPLNQLKKKIINYLLGKKIIWRSNLKLSGTPLQLKIWKEIKNIPYGQTKSYSSIASKLKTSPRYVGNVCGQNKHVLIVPCHRVLKKNGELGGYSAIGGIKLKKRLLNLES